MAIPGFGERTLTPLAATAVFTGHESQEGHQLLGVLKAAEIAQLGQDRHGGDQAHAPQGHQALYQRLQTPPLDRLPHVPLHGLHAPLRIPHGLHILLQHDVLGRRGECHRFQPAPVRLRPLGLASVDFAVAQQKGAQPLAGLGFDVLEVLAGATEIAQALLLFIRYLHRCQTARRVQLGQRQRIAPIRLDPDTGLAGNQ